MSYYIYQNAKKLIISDQTKDLPLIEKTEDIKYLAEKYIVSKAKLRKSILKKNFLSNKVKLFVLQQYEKEIISFATGYFLSFHKIIIERDFSKEMFLDYYHKNKIELSNLEEVSPFEYKNLNEFLECPSIYKTAHSKNKKIKEYMIDSFEIKPMLKEKFLKDFHFEITAHYNLLIESSIIKELFLKNELYFDYDIKQILFEMTSDDSNYLNTVDFYTIYKKGCKLLQLKPTYKKEYLEDVFSECNQDLLLALTNFYENNNFDTCDKEINTYDIDEIKNKILLLQNQKIILSDYHFSKFKKESFEILLFLKENEELCSSKFFIKHIDIFLKKISMIESYILKKENYSNALDPILKYDSCIQTIFTKGIVEAIEITYQSELAIQKIKNLIPKSPELEYPETRKINRHFIIHSGPTNSGKTYDAIISLKNSNTGIYLGPLRLLALEIQEKLLKDNILCSLLTGEEENIIPNATHIASTIEKVDLRKNYESCTIDECQLIANPDRGYAWTRAILGIKSDLIHLCTSPDAVSILIQLIELCQDTYEIVQHQRRSELKIKEELFVMKKDSIQDYDAYIVFSKKKVLQIASELQKMGISTSVIYGNLPYSVRKKQVERFLSGITKVVVSTDAIGMGMNLPVKRIIFLEQEKFNGYTNEKLDLQSIKQIGGRAGRNQETGFICTTNNLNLIKEAIHTPLQPLTKAYLGFSYYLLKIDASLKDILTTWKSIPPEGIFHKMNIDRYLELDARLKIELTKNEKLKVISIPFDEKNEYLFELWYQNCVQFYKENSISLPILASQELDDLENYYKGLDLYYCLAKNFKYKADFDFLQKEKEKISTLINESLIKNILI